MPHGESKGRQEPSCGRCRHRQDGAQLAAVQGPAFGDQALPQRPLGPPTKLAGDPPSPRGRPHGYGDSSPAT